MEGLGSSAKSVRGVNIVNNIIKTGLLVMAGGILPSGDRQGDKCVICSKREYRLY